RATIPSLSAMLGALFLWMFWPSVNSPDRFAPKSQNMESTSCG
nr:Rh blood group antigen-related polypeptide alpha isoform {C-terminal, alternatively spliced, clone RhPI-alpha} [human, cultured immature erythroblasts, Peptide Partial, 42 aa] [Homo sapiens]